MQKHIQSQSIKYLTLSLLSIIGLCLVLFSTRLYGNSLTPDSINYVSAARNLAEGNGLIAFDGSPLILWPPLYPFILSIPDFLFSIDPLKSANIINAVFFGLIVFFSGLLIFRYLKSSTLIQILGTIVVLLSLILLDIATHTWSEIVFIFFVQVFFYYIDVYREKQDVFSLLVISVSAALACLTRYIGMCIIMTGALMLIFQFRRNVRSGIIPLIVFIMISCLPIGIFLVRNHTISGTFFGSRNPSEVSIIQNLRLVLDVVREYGYFPVKVVKGNVFFLLIIIISFFAVSFGKGRFRETRPIIFFIFFYISFLVYSSSTYAYEQINYRYLSPLYIPLTLLFLISIEVLLEFFKKRISPTVVNASFSLGLIIWLLSYPLNGTIHYTRLWSTHGTGGFNSTEWHNSDLIKYVENIHLEQGQSIYTAETPTIYILTGIVSKNSSLPTLSKELFNIPDEGKELNNFDYYLWFNNYGNLYKWDELISSTNVKKLCEFKDGVVFAIFRVPM